MALLKSGKPKRPTSRKTNRAHAFAPDFFIIGAMKSGTTTLHQYLDQRDDVGMARIKETDYFLQDTHKALGVDWYKSQFDLTRACLGEASPNYTKYDIFPGVPDRIYAAAPEAKLIFIARDPVTRFASHYRHSWLHGHMRVAPEDLLASDNGRHMVECSRYAAQLEKYLEVFDRSQLLIVDFDQLCEIPQTVLDEIARFLELDPERVSELAAANTADHVARIPPFIKRAARSKLARRVDRFFPNGTRQALGRALSRRDPIDVPGLGEEILKAAAEMMRDDARRFRTLAGQDFSQWSV
ncbi:sulfotransferase [Roseovarius phycicola]|uniref:Sulfotransferase n=1 Tax=Roseovarius phycicola TaxID=3080976 RepID=A0ABZ2HN42_9RHOB